MTLKKVEKTEWKGEDFSLTYDDDGDITVEHAGDSFYVSKHTVGEFLEVAGKVRDHFITSKSDRSDDGDDCNVTRANCAKVLEKSLAYYLQSMADLAGPYYTRSRTELPKPVVELLRAYNVIP